MNKAFGWFGAFAIYAVWFFFLKGIGKEGIEILGWLLFAGIPIFVVVSWLLDRLDK
jgi:hypothetical protein